jgi:hypothetical protein
MMAVFGHLLSASVDQVKGTFDGDASVESQETCLCSCLWVGENDVERWSVNLALWKSASQICRQGHLGGEE